MAMTSIRAVFILLFAVGALNAAQDSPDKDATDKDAPGSPGVRFFETRVRPVLIKHCYECHSQEAETAEGGLRLDSRAAIRQGGSRGPAVVPGRPKASLLLAAVSHTDTDLKMPPEKPQLSKEVIADLEKWIAMGAPDPRQGAVVQRAQDDHWAYQPMMVRNVPLEARDPFWGLGNIDSYILAALEECGLKPSEDAAPEVLLRRIHFDLVGLPPTIQDIERFLKARTRHGDDFAIAKEVDRLLDSPQFGERWGRHWLDVARFAESSGTEANISFPYAWRYRDYVIDSVNADIPFDRFLTEQIAGDLLDYEDDAERARLLIATGFLAVGTKSLDEANDKQFEADIIDEQIDALTRAVLASSVACARCHHHKFDPFSMEDYYGLAGIFASTKTFFGTFTSPANRRGGDPLPLPRLEGQQIFHKSLNEKQFRQLKARQVELAAEWEKIQASQRARFAGKTPEKEFTLREVLANIWRRGPVEGKLETLDEHGRALPLTMGALDRSQIIDVPLLTRGEVNRPGEKVPRAFPNALALERHYAISRESERAFAVGPMAG